MNSIDKNWVDSHVNSNGEVIIPEGVEKIEAEAFMDNQQVKKVVMPNSIVEIAENAFSGCTNLEDIKFSNNLKVIGSDAFLDCKKITSIELPKTLEIIGEEAFARCEELEKVLIDYEAKIRELQDCIFYECKKLKEIEIPKSLKNIGEYVFCSCEQLQDIIFDQQSQLENIQEGAFFECKNLENINLPVGVKSIGKAAFKDCTALKSVQFDKNSELFEIGEQAFQMCENIKKIELPQNVELIGNYAFDACTSLNNIMLGQNVQSIGDFAFANCTKMQTIEIPNLVSKIGRGAFYSCTDLKDIEIGESVEEIGVVAFSSCKSLKRFQIPPKTKNIKNIFENCSELEELILGENTEQLSSITLEGCNNLRKVILNKNLKLLPEQTFKNCTNLEEIELQELQRLGYGAFKGNDSVRKITIDGNEFILDENEKLFSLQRAGEKVVIVTKDEKGKFFSKGINLEKGTIKTLPYNLYLTDEGKLCFAYNSLADCSLEMLKHLKEQGQNQLYIYGSTRDTNPNEYLIGINYDLYNVDDLIQIKSVIEEIKGEIEIPALEDKDRQKKIYGQLVRKLSKHLEYDFFETYSNAKNNDERNAEKQKCEEIAGKNWETYWNKNKDRDLITSMQDNGNLMGLLNKRFVCRGSAEIIRNLSAEFGIDAQVVLGPKHAWNQVQLDGVWYDDDFTLYQAYLSQDRTDMARKVFLCGQGKFQSMDMHKKTYTKTHEVGKILSSENKEILLNYGRVKQQVQQQTIQPHEKERPPEETIKDEVGDEFKTKTQQQKQQEQEAATEWMNRIGTVAQEVDKTNAGVNGKQEVAQLIKDLDKKQQKEQNKEQEQEEQQQDI